MIHHYHTVMQTAMFEKEHMHTQARLRLLDYGNTGAPETTHFLLLYIYNV